jgi:GNAT superfamily N-acetyltransferase
MTDIQIREATVHDASLILDFITGLAIYEKAEHEVLATEADICSSLFGEDSTAHGLICSINEQPAGFAVYFYNYSTWLGKPGLYLEDLYVQPEQRGSGAGTALLKHLAGIAAAKGCGRFEWSVLDWNEPAIKFYESLGARPQDEWVIYRMTEEALTTLAKS